MTRRCSHCSNNGHNSRTCPSRGGGGGVKLFGVRLTDGSIIKKSASMGNLTLLSSAHHHSSSLAASSPNPSSPCSDPPHEPDGYLSDDPTHASTFASRRGERKKGISFHFVKHTHTQRRNHFYFSVEDRFLLIFIFEFSYYFLTFI